MGILEKTRALLVARLGSRITDASADERALRDLIMELERCRGDILRGLDDLRREEETLRAAGECATEGSRLAVVVADIREGEAELDRVSAGIDEAQKAFKEAGRSCAPPPPRPRA